MILPVHKFEGNTIERQIAKLTEESGEVLQAYIDDESKERIIEETMDTIQVAINLLHMLTDAQGVRDSFDRHYDKMIAREYQIQNILRIKSNA